MARPPTNEAALVERYGPHLIYEPPGGWQSEAQDPAQKLVRTHCCFCGQQCGIQLKVRNNQVIGFEPWEEFPFNRGMLCPKGVKRYMQSTHPDRLLTPVMRDSSGFRPAGWSEALSFTATKLKQTQARYGRDAVAVYGGASLLQSNRIVAGCQLHEGSSRKTGVLRRYRLLSLRNSALCRRRASRESARRRGKEWPATSRAASFTSGRR